MGPMLWNLAFDRMVRTHLPSRCTTVCYADDTLVLAAGDSWAEAASTANQTVARVVRAIAEIGLRVAPQKSEVMYFYGASAGRPPEVRICVTGVPVTIEPALRYLGLTLDGRWSFVRHFKSVVLRADGVAGALERLLPNLRGLVPWFGDCTRPSCTRCCCTGLRSGLRSSEDRCT